MKYGKNGKPKISKIKGGLACKCEGDGFARIGPTPMGAYLAWVIDAYKRGAATPEPRQIKAPDYWDKHWMQTMSRGV